MTSPDFASPIPPEEFPRVFREVVREIGELVLQLTPTVQKVQQRLLEVPDADLIAAQRHSHFSRADVSRSVARNFSVVKDGQRAGSIQVSDRQR